jgi:hypothetical protein
MDIYCVKCKLKTGTRNSEQLLSVNNKNMLKGICSVCGSKKSSFLSKGWTGEGFGDILNNAIGKIGDLGVELHLPADKGEYVPNGSFNDQPKYSYCGPGTKYQQRANEGYNGINELDSMCKLHDRFYNENTDTKSRNVSDLALAHRADEIAKSSMFDATQRRDAKFVSGIMKNKARFGLGVGVSKGSRPSANKSKN